MDTLMKSGRVRIAWCAALLGVAAVGALALSAGVAEAGKKPPPPPPPPVPGGLVYFEPSGVAPRRLWTMHPDGSAKTALPAPPAGVVAMTPSHALHGGHRWFVGARVIPGVHAAIVAVRDDGAVVTDLVPSTPELGCATAYTRWSPDDAKISIIAMRYAGSTHGPYEVYVCEVLFDGDGNVLGLASQPTSPAISLTDVLEHDWSPDGTRLALTVAYGPTTGALWVADLASGGLTLLPTSLAAGGVAWSPDGTRIAFTCRPNEAGAIRLIAPDGSGETAIVSGAGSMNNPIWSPDGTYLVYQSTGDIYRVPRVGGTAVNLTGDVGGGPNPWGWR